MTLRLGKGTSYLAPSPQSRTCRTTASGSSVLILLTTPETKQATPRLAHNFTALQTVLCVVDEIPYPDSAQPAPQSLGVSLIWLVIPEYLPSFPPRKRYARLLLPYSGSLGPHFPTLPVCVTCTPDHRYYDPLRLPNAHLGIVRYSLSVPDTLYRVIYLFNGRV